MDTAAPAAVVVPRRVTSAQRVAAGAALRGAEDFDDVAMIAMVDAAPRSLEEPDGDEYARTRGWAVTDEPARDRGGGPSADIIPTSLRDLLGWRWAFRCTTPASSDVILGHDWASRGYSATDIDPSARGIGWLFAEGRDSARVRAACLTDTQVRELAALAARSGSGAGVTTPDEGVFALLADVLGAEPCRRAR